MKIIKKNFGFTLVEIMIALGIASALSIVILSAINQSMKVKGTLQRNGNVNNLIQLITSEMSRKDTCEVNFKGLSLSPAPIKTNLTFKNGSTIIQQNSSYGESITKINSIIITSSVSTTDPRLNKMLLSVTFQPKIVSGILPPTQRFDIPINVFLNAAGQIDTCYSDVQSLLENAVKFSCIGSGAKYYAKDATYIYGHCEHEAEIKASNNSVVVGSCPVGELLQMIDTTSNKMTFKCAKLTTTTTCPAWNYMKGINPDGSANCVDIRTLFPNSGFTTIRSGVYSVQNIACPANQVLQYIDASGTIHCVNPRYNYTCPVGQYVTGIDASGTVQCSYSSNKNACTAGMFMTAINSIGDVVCNSTNLLGACAGNTIVTGIDTSGNVICTLNQP